MIDDPIRYAIIDGVRPASNGVRHERFLVRHGGGLEPRPMAEVAMVVEIVDARIRILAHGDPDETEAQQRQAARERQLAGRDQPEILLASAETPALIAALNAALAFEAGERRHSV
jgi:hypothetical protein